MNAQESHSSDKPLGTGGWWLDESPNRSLEELEHQVASSSAISVRSEEWEQLRDLSVGEMQSNSHSDDIRIRWANLALAAISKYYDHLTDDPKKKVAESARVRSYLIQEFGASQLDEVRQPAALCAYVVENIDMTRDESGRDSAQWRTASRPQVLQLRRIKNMFTPLTPISEQLSADDPVRQDIEAWLTLLPRLP
ncbi:hypothetical protein AB0M39_02380 [Streptomyces sp. NPDC051907]|uniref:hypothetical protein n=1 Tax=Streptomyces sp. NPDC051907 TaxID=3155284 RepID=UPI0034133D7D